MEASTVQLEIDTLLHKNGADHKDVLIQSVIAPAESFEGQYDLYPVSTNPWRKELEHFPSQKVSTGFLIEEDRSKSAQSDPVESSVVVRGSDAGDFPTEYEIFGLNSDEVPAIGTYVNRSIAPGFKYRVRVLERNRYLFQGRSLYLQSVGRGYGKRITFQGDCLNDNNNYFYSDTNPGGFGFRITAVEIGDTFVILQNNGLIVGEGTVKETYSQKEVSSHVESDRTIVKNVTVQFTCAVKYGSSKHGLLPLCSEDVLEAFGTAVVVKNRGARAVTKIVQQVNLPNYGPCVLQFSK